MWQASGKLIEIVGIMGIIGVAGCSVVPPFVPPVLPAEMQSVVNDPDTFTLSDDLTRDPNAPPVSAADALTGCWGRAFDPQAISTDEAGEPLPGNQQINARAMELWHFDATAKTLEYEMYVRDESTGVILLEIIAGTFDLRAPGVLVPYFDTIAINDWTTGQMIESVPEGPDTDDSAGGTLLVQIDGDYLFLTGADENGTPGADKPWVLRRFDCP